MSASRLSIIGARLRVSVGALKSIGLLGAVSACRVVCALLIVKSLASLGPAQFGALSQVIGISTAFYAFAGGAVTNGLILNLARSQQGAEKVQWLSASFVVGLVTALLLNVVALAMFAYGSEYLLGDETLASIFLGVAAAQMIIGAGNNLLGYASGTNDLRAFAVANIGGSILWLLITVASTFAIGFTGALWAVVLTPSCAALIIIALKWKPAMGAVRRMPTANIGHVAALVKSAGLMVVAICSVPFAYLIIRADLALRSGWHDVGLWQAVVRLSDAYMQFFALVVVNLLLPRLVERVGRARNRETVRLGSLMLAAFVVGGAAYYWLRSHVLLIAFSTDFVDAAAYVAPQLFGDFAKLASWIIVYRFLSDGRLWVHPAAEVAQAAMLTASYYGLYGQFGAEAPVISHMLSCLVLAAVLIFAGFVGLRFRPTNPAQAGT